MVTPTSDTGIAAFYFGSTLQCVSVVQCYKIRNTAVLQCRSVSPFWQHWHWCNQCSTALALPLETSHYNNCADVMKQQSDIWGIFLDGDGSVKMQLTIFRNSFKTLRQKQLYQAEVPVGHFRQQPTRCLLLEPKDKTMYWLSIPWWEWIHMWVRMHRNLVSWHSPRLLLGTNA